jgi:hypothetical protein
MHFSIQHLAAVAATASISLAFTPVMAAVYQAHCSGGSECTVILANGQITMPGLVIQKDQVLSWSQGGSGTKVDVGMGVVGVAGAVLLGVPALPGFTAKKHDYQYNINYVDDAGRTAAASVGFKNNVPANLFMMEIMGMTGLIMGEVNQQLYSRLSQIRVEAAEKARIAALVCSPVIKTYSCSWNAYLAANPAVKIWANTNPLLVPAEKARLRAID